ncbi:hypothetical protein CKM354_000986500 [Cercospora kikuchii]|uniref:Uncharacterized protein n=1 Tax=Cercospora kikuchii TaxID=84275 RepID=A0A9P3CP50_9PEZI|nr:uncharacterized protein CKM354_000986500 [Cercospora kikuchii]GIZ46752.1 hypothetical protein CKM354_000986500 [Cercospora kikuchii]
MFGASQRRKSIAARVGQFPPDADLRFPSTPRLPSKTISMSNASTAIGQCSWSSRAQLRAIDLIPVRHSVCRESLL